MKRSLSAKSRITEGIFAIMLSSTLLTASMAGCKPKPGPNESKVSSQTDSGETSGEISSADAANVSESVSSAASGGIGERSSSRPGDAAASAPQSGSSDSGKQSAEVKVNSFNASDVFIVTVDATKAPYNADKTGKADATTAIQNALNQCSTSYGGGIVFLPAGTYKISSTLNIKSHVILKGEYNDPAKANGNYGTVVSAGTNASAFKMNGASGVSGITVYYPGQSLSSPLASDYTFAATAGNFTLENITLLNSYRGIGVCVEGKNSHGLVRLNNVRGTVLYQGINMKWGSEVSFINGVSFAPSYWAGATSKYGAPSEADIKSWMASKSDCGLDTAGLEGPGFANMLLDGFRTGIRNSKTPRSDNAETYAQYYNVTVRNAVTAVDLPYSYIDMGTLFASCSLSGSSLSVKNTSPNVAKLFNCTLSGNTEGNVVTSSASVSVPIPETGVPRPAKQKLFNAAAYGADSDGKTDCSAALQKALNAARDNGGGYVYLPGGIYRLDKPITVYAGTELCGSNAVAGADTFADYASTVIFAYYGRGKSATDQALVTLAGKNAGCTGIRFYYPANGVTKKGGKVDNNVTAYAYTIRGAAEGAYCKNLNFYAAYYGIEMSGASNYIVKDCIGSFYKNGIGVKNCTGGLITGCLSNNGQQGFGTSFSYLPDFADWLTTSNANKDDMYTYLIHGVGRKMHDYIIYTNSTKQVLVNTFAYIPHVFLTASGSEITAANVYGSRMGAENSMFLLNGGKLTSVNNYLKLSKVAVFSGGAQAGIYNIKGQILPAGVSEDNIIK